MPFLSFTKLPIFFSLSALAILSACGGSGDGNPNSSQVPNSPVILTGVFIDSAVQGLSFSTSSQSGMTNEQGEFFYIDGEDITFSIGDIQFPAVTAQNVMSPLDVFSVTNINDVRVANMARLLQTLDRDGISGNGITITDDAHNQARGVIVDFSSDDFDIQVEDIVANSGAVNTSLIEQQQAIEHLSLSLTNLDGVRECSSDSTKIGYTGEFTTFAHNVSGTATIIDDCTIEVTMFNFDGMAPNVRFYAGVNGNFSGSDAFGIGERIDGQSFTNETILLVLPEGRSVEDFDSLSVWCVAFNADFGSLRLEAQ
ncbi:DM13 domain-containing protein [Paraglaciecola sp. 2405UD69-4]|uniref:DM13 domain-containing protein n=1 Tax=Paraglaciecola sp. 2405UD69-4 TaxID=3391836 RepID=UPI0039C9EBDC